jgi:hypothetical protein
MVIGRAVRELLVEQVGPVEVQGGITVGVFIAVQAI